MFAPTIVDSLGIYSFLATWYLKAILYLESPSCGKSWQMPPFSDFKRHLVLDVWEFESQKTCTFKDYRKPDTILDTYGIFTKL